MTTQRFLRTELLIGKKRLDRLRRSTVTIVGLGAVGGYAMEGLARSGVGRLRLIGFDVVEAHNINRQIIALESTIGRKKAELARQRVKEINPDCKVEAVDLFVTRESIRQVLTPRPDILIDAIDSLNSKVNLLVAAYNEGIETVSSMGAALRTDPSFIKTGDIMDTERCPLAKHMRKRLKRREVGRGITCVYSTEPVNFDYRQEEKSEPAPQQSGRGRRRNTLGSLPTITGIFGLTIANIAVRKLCAE